MATVELGRAPESSQSPVNREYPSQIYFSPAWIIDQHRKYWETISELSRPILTPPEWTTPNKVELKRENVTLRNFTDGISSNEPPILILPPQAGHGPTIVDYDREQSLVEVAIRTGAPVYACDWPPATYERRHETIDDFIESTNACVETISKNGKGVTLVGLCQGGWQAAIYASLNPDKINRLILAGAPIDFHAGNGMITNYALTLPMSYYEWLVAAGNGNMPGESMLMGFKLLDPLERFIKDPIDLFHNIDDKKFVERRRKLNDWYEFPQDIPGDFYLQIVKELFKENRLIKIKGGLEVLGERVDLSRISCPVTLLAGSRDHITPPDQLFNARHYVGSKDIEISTVDAGHIGLFMSHNALRNYWPNILKSPAAGSSKRTAA